MSVLGYLAEVQGFGQDELQLYFSWSPTAISGLPTPNWVIPAMCQPPIGSITGAWDIVRDSTSTGRFRLHLDPDEVTRAGFFAGFNLRAVSPSPIANITNSVVIQDYEGPEIPRVLGMTATTTTLTTSVSYDNLQSRHGIGVGTTLYIGSESVRVTGGSGFDITASRGQYGSDATTHRKDAGIFMTPPGLWGRYVIVREIPSTGDPLAGEIVLVGFIGTEAVGGPDGTVIVGVQNTFPNAVIGRDIPDRESRFFSARSRAASPHNRLYGSPLGQYIHHVNTDDVYACVREPLDLGRSILRPTYKVWPERVGVGVSLPNSPIDEYAVCLFSDPSAPYPPFRFYDVGSGSWIPYAHPVVVSLNLLLSRDGDNYHATDVASFDLGDARTTDGGLFPEFSLGVPREFVDVDAFLELLFGILAPFEANHLFISSHNKETIGDILRRLWAPLGYTVGPNKEGRWAPIAIRDLYPEVDGSITQVFTAKPKDVEFRAIGRAISSVKIEVEPGPKGVSDHEVIIEEVGEASFYPGDMGVELVIKNAPYKKDIHQQENLVRGLFAEKLRKTAGKMMEVSNIKVGADGSELAIGQIIELRDSSLWCPYSGEKVDYLTCMITEIASNHHKRSSLVTVIVIPTLRTALRGPGLVVGTISSYGAFYEVTPAFETAFAPPLRKDVEFFMPGMVLDVLDGVSLNRLSALDPSTTVVEVLSDSIIVSDNSGGTILPDRFLVPSRYHLQPESVTDRYAFGARYGVTLPAEIWTPSGVVEPYVIGGRR